MFLNRYIKNDIKIFKRKLISCDINHNLKFVDNTTNTAYHVIDYHNVHDYIQRLANAKLKNDYEEMLYNFLKLGDYYTNKHQYADATKLYCAGLAVLKKLTSNSQQNIQLFINEFKLVKPCFIDNKLIFNVENIDNQIDDTKNMHDLIKMRIKSVESFLVNTIVGKAILVTDVLLDQKRIKKLKNISIYAENKIKDVIASNDLDEDKLLERATKINEIYLIIQQKLYGFIRCLITDCKKILGEPPQICKYAFVTFGSLAKQRATPYSDLEWGVLIEEGKASEENVQYFINLAKLLEIKIIQLEQTSIPLNFFEYEGKPFYIDFDDILKPGFQLDLGGKTPLGRPDKDYCLIQTPQGMLQYLSDSTFEKDKFLPIEIAHCDHLAGDRSLTENFLKNVESYLKETVARIPRYVSRALILLLEGTQELMPDLRKYTPNLVGNEYETSFYNTKQEIYRLPDRLIEGLALYQGVISAKNTWQMIDNLCKNNCINQAAARNLKIGEAIAAEIRLRTYLKYKCQNEHMSVIGPFNAQNISPLENMFCLEKIDDPKSSLLFRFYYIMLPLHNKLEDFLNSPAVYNTNINPFEYLDFFDDSDLIKGKIYARIMRYQKAIDNIKFSIDKRYLETIKRIKRKGIIHGWDIFDLLSDLTLLSNCYAKLQDYINQDSYIQKIAKIYEKIKGGMVSPITEKGQSKLSEYTDTILKTQNHNQAAALHNLGASLVCQYKYDEGINKLEEALQLYKLTFPENDTLAIADTQVTLGVAHFQKSEWYWTTEEENIEKIQFHRQKSRDYFSKALSCYRKTSNKNSTLKLAILLANFASLNLIKENYHEAILQLQEALPIAKKQVGPYHLLTAKILNILGDVYHYVDANLANNHYEQAIAIYEALSKSNVINPLELAHCLTNLGNIYIDRRKYKEAEEYLDKAKFCYDKKTKELSLSIKLDGYVHLIRNLIRVKLHRIYEYLSCNKNDEFCMIILLEVLQLYQSLYSNYKVSNQRFLKKNLSESHNTFEIINWNKSEMKDIIVGLASGAIKNSKLLEAIDFYQLALILFSEDELITNKLRKLKDKLNNIQLKNTDSRIFVHNSNQSIAILQQDESHELQINNEKSKNDWAKVEIKNVNKFFSLKQNTIRFFDKNCSSDSLIVDTYDFTFLKVDLDQKRLIFKRLNVSSDGDCGYTAFGITRTQAYQLLIDNLNTIRNIIKPAIQEALRMEAFNDALKNQDRLTQALSKAYDKYVEASNAGGEMPQDILDALDRAGDDSTILLGYIDYDVKDKQIDAGWSHPCILFALAKIQGIELNIWQCNDQGELVVHPYYPRYTPVKATQRTDLLFINNNHFERLELIDTLDLTTHISDTNNYKI